MSDHTPKPWHYELPGYDEAWIMGPDNHGFPHAIIKEDHTQGGEIEANASLIAAAPDMLEALENLENDDGTQMPYTAWELVQNAIKKAGGRVKTRGGGIEVSKFETLQDWVLDWADERGIFEFGTPLSQIEKTREEVEETRDALVRLDENTKVTVSSAPRRADLDRAVKDGIGDTVVTLIILARLCGTDIEECLELAYNEIKDRKGKMVDGIFVKEGGSK